MSGRTRVPGRPERTCVGCRERAAKTGLLRVVLIQGRCVPDLRGTLPGRGAYIHTSPGCLELAVRRRAFLRAFRVRGGPAPLDTAELEREVSQAPRKEP